MNIRDGQKEIKQILFRPSDLMLQISEDGNDAGEDADDREIRVARLDGGAEHVPLRDETGHRRKAAEREQEDRHERGEPGADVDFGTHDRWLADELTTLFRSRTFDEWLELFLAADVPAGPAYEPEDVPDVAHVQERGALRRVRVAGGEEIVVPSWPVREAGADPLPLVDVPTVGQHTAEVLTEAGCTEAQIAAARGT